jgi:hypothetical protein
MKINFSNKYYFKKNKRRNKNILKYIVWLNNHDKLIHLCDEYYLMIEKNQHRLS